MDLKLLIREMTFRWASSLLILVALVFASAMLFAAPTILSDYTRQADLQIAAKQRELNEELALLETNAESQLQELKNAADKRLADLDKKTKRVMRDLGFNLRIVHKDTELTGLLADYEAMPIPQDYVDTLAQSPEITKIVHIVATIKRMIRINGQARLIVGYSREATQSHIGKKPPMGFQIEKGTVYLGNLAGQEHSVGEEIEILGKSFKVAQILPFHGSRDRDILIGMNLEDAQLVLELPNQITEIIALGCKCKTVNRIEEIRDQLESVLPETRIFELRTQAIARDQQRNLVTAHYRQQMDDLQASNNEIMRQVSTTQTAMIEQEQKHHDRVSGLLNFATGILAPCVLLFAGIWVSSAMWINAASRQEEFGILRAIGKSSRRITALLLGKAAILGLIASLAGIAIGIAVSYLIGNRLTERIEQLEISYLWIVACTLLIPVIAILASALPAGWVARQDPARILSGE